MRVFTRLQRIVAGLGGLAAGASGYYLYDNLNNRKVFASWTTTYEPSCCGKWDHNWDKRDALDFIHPKKLYVKKDENNNIIEEENEKISKSRAMRHLILIRHGQYNLNGATDMERTLTKLGQTQAEYTGKRLKQLDLPYSDIVKSTMTRAQETGSIIENSLPKLPVKHCELLREGAPIPPEPPIGHWKRSNHQFYVDGARIEAAFRKYFYRAEPSQSEDSYTVVVCHANVIRYFVCRALQFPAEGWLRINLNHGSITWISITPTGRVILRCLGDTGHMPPDIITSH